MKQPFSNFPDAIGTAGEAFQQDDHEKKLEAVERWALAITTWIGANYPEIDNSIGWALINELENLKSGRSSRLFQPLANRKKGRQLDPNGLWVGKLLAVLAAEAKYRADGKVSWPKAFEAVVEEIERHLSPPITFDDVVPGSASPITNERKKSSELSLRQRRLGLAGRRLDAARDQLKGGSAPEWIQRLYGMSVEKITSSNRNSSLFFEYSVIAARHLASRAGIPQLSV